MFFSSIIFSISSIKIECNIKERSINETFKMEICVPNNFTSSENDFVENGVQLNVTSLLITNSISNFIPKNFSNFLPHLKIFTFIDSNLVEISENSFKNQKMLIEVNLRRNKIEKINEKSFFDLVNVEKLFLDSNKISHLENNTFSTLINLEEIYLNDNLLEVLSSKIFQNNKKLRLINLEINHLKNLPQTIFAGLNSLTELYLDHNKISEIPNRIFISNKELKILTISYNEINLIGDENFDIFKNLIKHDFLQNPCLDDLTWGYDIDEMKIIAEENCKPNCEDDRKWLLDEIIENSHKREKRSLDVENQKNIFEINSLKNKIENLEEKFSQIYENFKKIENDLNLKIDILIKERLDDKKIIDGIVRNSSIFQNDIEMLKNEEKNIKSRLNAKKNDIFENQGKIKSINQTFNEKFDEIKVEMLMMRMEIMNNEEKNKRENLLTCCTVGPQSPSLEDNQILANEENTKKSSEKNTKNTSEENTNNPLEENTKNPLDENGSGDGNDQKPNIMNWTEIGSIK